MPYWGKKNFTFPFHKSENSNQDYTILGLPGLNFMQLCCTQYNTFKFSWARCQKVVIVSSSDIIVIKIQHSTFLAYIIIYIFPFSFCYVSNFNFEYTERNSLKFVFVQAMNIANLRLKLIYIFSLWSS